MTTEEKTKLNAQLAEWAMKRIREILKMHPLTDRVKLYGIDGVSEAYLEIVGAPDVTDACDCSDCQYSEKPCHSDCSEPDLCQGCRESLEHLKDREFEEKLALGHL